MFSHRFSILAKNCDLTILSPTYNWRTVNTQGGTKYKVVFSCTTFLNTYHKKGWMVWFAVINVAKFELIVHWNRKSWMLVFCKIVRKLFLRHFELTFVSKDTFSTKWEHSIPECWFWKMGNFLKHFHQTLSPFYGRKKIT